MKASGPQILEAFERRIAADKADKAIVTARVTACTSAATEYRKKRASDPDVYNVEIECMNEGEIEGLLRQCVVDYRQYHLRDLEHPLANSEEEALQKKAKVAWDTLTAAFGNIPGCTEVRFQDQAISIDYMSDNDLF